MPIDSQKCREEKNTAIAFSTFRFAVHNTHPRTSNNLPFYHFTV